VTSQIYFDRISEKEKTGPKKFITQVDKWMFGAEAKTGIVKH
jgi:hypothetical protein